MTTSMECLDGLTITLTMFRMDNTVEEGFHRGSSINRVTLELFSYFYKFYKLRRSLCDDFFTAIARRNKTVLWRQA
jgi:hypothetical protein